LAQRIRKRAAGATEIYVAYGSTEALFNICAQQADYDIPEVKEKIPTPLSPTGEELGIGDSWWYKGNIQSPSHTLQRSLDESPSPDEANFKSAKTST
jgi:hypothetical protein